MKYFKDQKALLFTIEGFDRTGKRTLLKNLKEKYKDDNSVYIYITPDDPNKPDFREDVNIYQQWLAKTTQKQMEDIIKLSEKYDVIIKKDLLLSDLAFSEQFHRKLTVIDYMDELREHFTVINLVMLFASFNDYVSRIQKIKQLLKYNILDYKLTVDKFKTYSKRCFNNYGDLYHIHAQRYFHSPNTIAKDFMIYINSMRNVLFNRNKKLIDTLQICKVFFSF